MAGTISNRCLAIRHVHRRGRTFRRSTTKVMRVSSITHKNGAGTTLASLVYAYDAGSRLTSETIGGTTTTYTYQTNNDQLESDGTTTWTYDANGNRTSGGSSPTTGNRLTSDGTYTYLYDDESNVTAKTDASGNHWDFKYDQKNQMTEAKYTNSGGTVIQTNDYTYGPFGERLKAVHTESGNDWTREFAYDAWNPAKRGGVGNEAFDIWADLDGTNISHPITTRYFDGDNVDGKLARAVGSAEQWLLGDKLGSIRDITNSSGTLVNTVAYDAWGKVLSQTGAGSNDVGRYAFTGRERDVESGLQYNRARYYDPSTGRWQTQDPMGFDAGDSNLNRYVKNAPTNFCDPSGMLALFFDGAAQTEKTRSTIYLLYLASKEPAETKFYITSPVVWKDMKQFERQAVDAAKTTVDACIQDVKNQKKTDVDVFGWSRGAALAVATINTLAEFFKKEKLPFATRFVGLIDPVATGVGIGIQAGEGRVGVGLSPSTIPDIVPLLWLGVRDGSKDKNDLKAPLFPIMNLKIANPAVTQVTTKKYALTHGDTGFDRTVRADLLAAATAAGVAFGPVADK